MATPFTEGCWHSLHFPADIRSLTKQTDGTLRVVLVTGSNWRLWKLKARIRTRKLS
jgi:hypothetical protein